MSFLPGQYDFYTSAATTPLATGKLVDGLYHLEFQADSSLNHVVPTLPASHAVTSKHQLSAMWHLRLGHASGGVLHKISPIRGELVDDYNKQCPICPISKQTQLPFPVSTSRASHIFDLIYTSTCGDRMPMKRTQDVGFS